MRRQGHSALKAENGKITKFDPHPSSWIPINDRVLIRRDVAPEKIGSIIVPDVAKEQVDEFGSMLAMGTSHNTGTVVATGPGKWLEGDIWFRRPMSVKPGDRVMFGRFADFDDKGLCVIQEDDILGVLSVR